MKTSRIATFSSGLALVSAVVVASVCAAACSSTAKGADITTDTMPAAAEDAAAPHPTTDSAAPVVNPPKKDAGPVTLPPAGECSSEVKQTDCVTCCSNKHMDGSGVYFVALIDCMCLPANCAKDCEKTLCDPNKPQNADATCQTCVQAKNSACSTVVKNTCQADTDCVAFDACIGKSDCTGKTN